MSERITVAHPSARHYLAGSVTCPHLETHQQQPTDLGLGGIVTEDPSHFMVHEVPKYYPSGEGEHAMALILKCNRTTEEAVSAIAEASGLSVGEVGYAGRKDKKALTTQWLTFPTTPERLTSNDPEVQLLCCAAHRQKLRLGHNVGNTFSILVSHVTYPERLPDALARMRRGIPNYFGQQRFGRPWYERRPIEGYSPPMSPEGVILQDPDNPSRDNVDRALMFLDRAAEARSLKRLKGKQKRDIKLALSALQSALFNLWIGERIHDGLIHEVIEGDVCRKIEGGTFYSTEPQIDTERLRRGEIVVLGPMVGPKLFPAQGLAKQREERLYEEWGLNEQRRGGLAKAWRGDRRPSLLIPRHLSASSEVTIGGQTNVRLSFTLPSGSFATAVLGALIDPLSDRFERSNL